MRPVTLVVVVLGLLSLCIPAAGIFVQLDEPVPVDRLIANLKRFVDANPQDASGHYTLGRVHSLAYAKLAYGQPEPDRVRVITPEKRRLFNDKEAHPDLPTFAPYDSVRVGPGVDQPPAPSAAALKHLQESLAEYAQAVRLAPDNGLYHLGNAWMGEQAALYAEALAKLPPNGARPQLPTTKPDWREQALASYRGAFALRFNEDIKTGGGVQTPDRLVSREAATAIIRLLERDGITDAERREIDEMRDALGQLAQLPMAITPIVFAMEQGRPWNTIVSESGRTRFDLAGDGGDRQWPWLKADVGLLVWDPDRTRRIASGRQLFGTSTWWIFWETGYHALAALDDDGDGQLRGGELDGIAAWFDRDGNGQSDQGEVVSLSSLRIVALRTAGESHSAEDVAAWNPAGIELAGGQTLPTWDWRPTSLALAPDPRK